ncbi:M20 family metallopeptidase [Samsonia erythrinae]|uniref:Acetylornithine deacetylase/succinyl-diaminopimelate desuccinylase-like protein n=1 Tax=Samsonia erythrinae TaxID=160434 RepID=A0A4R3VIZ5_9GAMM|nr:M20 family metallopeptidase [Samsonia erythrinae]TCV05781.1 acetylornithine deacetylase/succinyl-diaminopimelate desuccinylase-like protein [Samsonia erythrinae]
MTSADLIRIACERFDRGEFKQTLARRIAHASESQKAENQAALSRYLTDEIQPALQAMGFRVTRLNVSGEPHPPFLLAERIEDPSLPTVLSYGHGDVVFGDEENWRDGLTPWALVEEGDRWYGRGCADNKGQHSINLMALEQVFQARGQRLGFNCKLLFEMGEEIGSPGLADLCRQYKQALAADIFIASDGPRLSAERPTLFLGSRGCVNFRLHIKARDRAYHSGNWGGLLSNPGTQLANAVASLVDEQGRMKIDALLPPPLTPALRKILSTVVPAGSADDPPMDENWGAEGLTPAERLFGWNTLEVLSFITGNPHQPVNAIPAEATAICQLRFVVGTDWQHLAQHMRQHLDRHGCAHVDVEVLNTSPATRFNPEDPLVNWTLALMQHISGKQPALLPNLGGSLPNDVFADILGLPTLWIPHSYPACGQHAVNEHLLKSVAREGLAIMTGLFWELGEQGRTRLEEHRAYVRQK